MVSHSESRDEGGAVTPLETRMADISQKAVTRREALARGRVRMQAATLTAILDGQVPKGDVITIARIAGIQGAKRCPDLIPLCHPLLLTGVDLEISPNLAENCVEIEASVRCEGRTGVEMEALCAVSAAALTVYDMCKPLDKSMIIEGIMLLEKRGGKSGDFVHPLHVRPLDQTLNQNPEQNPVQNLDQQVEHRDQQEDHTDA